VNCIDYQSLTPKKAEMTGNKPAKQEINNKQYMTKAH
jgi:hypothetical protein